MDWSRFQLVALAVIAGLVAIRALLLWFSIRVVAFKIAHRSELAFFACAAFFVLLQLRTAGLVAFPLPAWADSMIVHSEAARRVGAFLVAAAIVIFILALLSFRNSWRVGIDTRTPGQLVTTGIFAHSRNPIFVFMDLYLVATFLLNGTVAFLVMAFVGIIGLHLQIRREERFLRQRHGAEYQEYCSTVPRYFG